MSLPPTPPPVDDIDLLAAEYALGVLEGAAYAKAAALMKSSTDFASAVTAWEARLSPLIDDVAPVAAPNLLPAIEARLFGHTAQRSALNLPLGWLKGLLGTGVMAALSVVVLALMLQFGGTGGTDQPVHLATLMAEGSGVRYLALLDGGEITLTRTAGIPPPHNRSYELWLIDGDKPPVSLGLIDAALTLPAPNFKVGYVLAITDEPLGGGPNGVATGPVVAAGKFISD